MKMIRMYRVNGDTLSCWFSPRGTLSTAVLTAGEEERQVAGQLVGITVENAVEYLEEIGYGFEYDPLCLKMGKVLNEAVADKRMVVESVKRANGSFLISVIPETGRLCACPQRLFIVEYTAEGSEIKFIDVQNEQSTRVFYESVTIKGDI